MSERSYHGATSRSSLNMELHLVPTTHIATGRLRAGANQSAVARHRRVFTAIILLIGFGCITTTQGALVTDQVQGNREREKCFI